MCGIFGIANHSDASRMAHLGLYALQHRGQESTGISSSDGDQVFTHKSMGYVADVFSEDVLKRLKGRNAIAKLAVLTSFSQAHKMLVFPVSLPTIFDIVYVPGSILVR